MGSDDKQLVYSQRNIVMDDIQLKDQDIAELFNRMPEAKREAIIIAQERMIKELRDHNLELSKKNLNGVKKVKAGV